MTRRRLTVTYVLVAVLGGGVVSAGNRGAARLRGQEYDIVLAGGHVLDPETGLDATRHVGIQGGRIAAVTTELPAAQIGRASCRERGESAGGAGGDKRREAAR